MSIHKIKNGIGIIPVSVTEIGHRAFEGCTSLTEIAIPDSVTEIGYMAFSRCTSLKEIAIPDSVTKIGPEAFDGCTSLTKIVIPHSVTDIGVRAFCRCTNLREITVAKHNPKYDSRNGSNAIIESDTNTLITGCKSTIIPDSVTKIGSHAFGGCTSLTEIAIPDSVTEIGDKAFAGCTSLTKMVIPDSVTEIESYVTSFKGCNSLRIPKSIKINEDSNCFITSAVCKTFGKPDNCQELMLFRHFRDTYMTERKGLTHEVEKYYEIAPAICAAIDAKGQAFAAQEYARIWEDHLLKAFEALNNNELEKTYDIYKNMVLSLEKTYLG